MNPRARAATARAERDLFAQSVLESKTLSITIEPFDRRCRIVLSRPGGHRFHVEAHELRAVIVALQLGLERLGGE
jgi:hypothetical protein